MASVLKVDKLDPQSGTALEIGTSGDTISLPSGATLDISASTLTPPATMPESSGVNLTALNATQLTSGTVPTARLGSGTASSSTVLYGDQTYKTEPTGGKVLQVITTAASSRTTTTSGSDQTAATSSAITPSETTSKILVLASGFVGQQRSGDQLGTYSKIFRDISGGTSDTLVSSAKTAYSDSEYLTMYYKYGGGTHPNALMGNVVFNILDSCSTTSAVTYKWMHRNSGGDLDIVGGVVFTLLEIGA